MPKFRELIELGADFDDISKTFTKDEIIQEYINDIDIFIEPFVKYFFIEHYVITFKMANERPIKYNITNNNLMNGLRDITFDFIKTINYKS